MRTFFVIATTFMLLVSAAVGQEPAFTVFGIGVGAKKAQVEKLIKSKKLKKEKHGWGYAVIPTKNQIKAEGWSADVGSVEVWIDKDTVTSVTLSSNWVAMESQDWLTLDDFSTAILADGVRHFGKPSLLDTSDISAAIVTAIGDGSHLAAAWTHGGLQVYAGLQYFNDAKALRYYLSFKSERDNAY